MKPTSANTNTWNRIQKLFDEHANQLVPVNRNKYSLKGIEELLAEKYPEIYADPQQLLTETGETREVSKSVPGSSPLWESYRYFLKVLEIDRKLQEVANGASTETVFFTSTHVAACVKQWLLNHGWQQVTYNFVGDGIFSLQTQLNDKQSDHSLFARAIGSVYKYYDFKGRPHKAVNVLRGNLASGLLQMIEKKHANPNLRCCLFFAEDEATHNFMTPYISFLKNAGFEVYSVKSLKSILAC